jgi:hypothetical protein
MIPTIGVMVGMYIITRMAELLGRPDRGIGSKVMAGLTMLVAIVGILDLVVTSASRSPGLNP